MERFEKFDFIADPIPVGRDNGSVCAGRECPAIYVNSVARQYQ
jgi:hypothetical protein